MPAPFHLTFGVELEFVCVFPRGVFNDQEPNLVPTDEELDGHITAGHALQYFLHAANVPATGWEELGTVSLDAAPFSSWLIKEDCLQLSESEREHIPDGYVEEAIEIASPILRFFGDDWRGLHVHIGNAGGQEMPFDTVKRMFQLATAHERVIDSMHASSRVLAPIPNVTDNTNLLYAPLSFFHRRKDHAIDCPANNVFDWLRRIEDMHSFEDFYMLFGGELEGNPLSGHSSTVNFDNLWSDSFEVLNNTVEFRQHVGTLDYAGIVAWVTFLANFTHFCHSASDTDIVAVALRATDTDFTAAHLMSVIGCDQDIISHYDYDGESSTIGMLPSNTDSMIPPSPSEDTLLNLTAQNDDETSSNTDHIHVRRLINQKLSLEYYGFDSTLGMLPLGEPLIADMLRRAYGKVSQLVFTVLDLQMRGDVSQARNLVFDILSAMHNYYDPTMGPLQPAIAEGVRRLA